MNQYYLVAPNSSAITMLFIIKGDKHEYFGMLNFLSNKLIDN